MLKTSKIRTSTISCLILAVGLVCSFNTIYIAQDFLRVYLISAAMCFISILFLFLRRAQYRFSKYRLILILLILMLDYIYVILRVRILYGFLILGIAFPVFLLFTNANHYYIVMIFENLLIIATILAIISLIYWIGGSLLNILQPMKLVNITWGYSYKINKYSIFYFTPQYANLYFMGRHIGVRNCSIFAEAPMASSFYCIALILNEFYIKKNPKIINTIFAITIISTLSVSGWIIVILFAVYKVMKCDIRSNIGKIFKLAFVLIAASISIGLVYSLISNKLATGSGIDRSYHIAMEWNSFLKNPLIGYGFNSYTDGSSNSMFSLMADGGLILLTIYYLPVIGMIIIDIIYNKRINWFMIFFIFVFIISVIQYTFIIVFLTAFNWKLFIDKISNKKTCKREKVWGIRQIC